MVDAPAGTAHDYFSFADSYSGFSVYTPNYQVKEEGGRVTWVLKHNQTVEPEIPDKPATPDAAPVTPAEGNTVPDIGTDTPAEGNTVPDIGTDTPAEGNTVPDTGADTPAEGNTVPDTGADTPAEGNTVPDTGADTPAEGNTVPDAGTNTPAEGNTIPDTGADTPEEGNSIPDTDMDVPAQGETKPDTGIDSQTQGNTTPGESNGQGKEEKTDPEASADRTDTAEKPAFNPDDWFTIYDNQPLIQDTRAMMASRQYIFSEAVSQLHSRTDSLRTSPGSSGSWGTLEQRKGRFLGLNASQQTLNLGWDRQEGTQIAGLSASYTQGQIEGKGKENHRLATLGGYYSWQSDNGWFADAAGQFMYLKQELTLDPALGINGKKPDSHMLAGGLRTGYQFRFASDTIRVSPFIGVSGGVLSGYSLQGDDAEVSLSSGNVYYGNAGVMVQKYGLGTGLENVNLFTSVTYQYSPGKNGPETTLADRQSKRQYDAWSDNRYRAKIGIEGIITPSLSLNAKAESSFSGEFKTDYSGVVGLSYHF
ncbi:autotransporter outer membrane beta-barrel domain-containing protein [Erwinia sp. P6884]|uniref:autotransporter outer membrane beta-barrel domain-containing protein n=1 Tax=Erwinia sp. P6884 TaxID=3141450 RepID=UPI00319459DC